MIKTADGYKIVDGMRVYLFAGMMDGILESKVLKVYKKPKKYVFTYRCPHSGKVKKAIPDQLVSVFKTRSKANELNASYWD